MKCFIQYVVVMSVTLLNLSWVTSHAAPAAGLRQRTTHVRAGAPVLAGNGAAIGAVFQPTSGPGDDHQPTAHRARPEQFFDQSSQPIAGAITLDNKTTWLSGGGSVNAELHSVREPMRTPLSARGLEFYGRVQPATPSLVGPNGRLNFRLFNPLVRTASKNENQALQIAGVNTRAWTTVVGWHPGAPVFTDAWAYEAPHFDLLCVGTAPQP